MFDEKSYGLKMDKAIEVFSKELSSLRTGRANASMLDLIKVDVYGQQMPINQVGSITTPEPRMINIQVWDSNNVSLVDAAIQKSDLGLNPQIDGQLIRLPVPELNEERRTELKKLIKSNIDAFALPVRKDDSSLENTSIALSILRLYDFSSNIYSPIFILKNSGNPENIAKKISLGKMNKFKEENALLTQAWVMEPKKKVKDVLKELSIADLKIKEFYRIKIGE